jgi:hypothetical protein
VDESFEDSPDTMVNSYDIREFRGSSVIRARTTAANGRCRQGLATPYPCSHQRMLLTEATSKLDNTQTLTTYSSGWRGSVCA